MILQLSQTGPKGVVNDWRKYKQLETEKRDEADREKLELIKKLSITCRSHVSKYSIRMNVLKVKSDDSLKIMRKFLYP